MTAFRWFALALWPALLCAQEAVLTAHYDVARTGANRHERILNPGNVNKATFGRLGSLPVQGCVIAQPLYVPRVAIPGVGRRNVVYVATTANIVYAFDADTFELLNQRSLGTPVPSAEINPQAGYWVFPDCDGIDDVGPLGVVGTPVIEAGSMYVVANVSDPTAPPPSHHHLLFKLDIRNLKDRIAPVTIAGEFNGKKFDSYYHLQRSALLLANRRVYIAFGSHADETPYAGWMFAYDLSLRLLNVVSYSQDRSGAGIWQSGAGPAYVDGAIYLTTGNNAEGVVGPDDNADSILQIDPQTLHVTAKTSFPDEANDWDYNSDLDLGSSRVVSMPGKPFVVSGSKFGDMFVIDRDGMQLVNRFQAGARHSAEFDWTGTYNGFAVWNDYIFVWQSGSGGTIDPSGPYISDVLRSYRLHDDGRVELIAQGETSGTGAGYQGPGLVISSNADDPSSAIVWAAIPDGGGLWLRRGRLEAYAATSTGVFRTLWTDSDVPDPDHPHMWAKFSQPLIANGHVFLPTFSGTVEVYGLFQTALPSLPRESEASRQDTLRQQP